MKETGFMERSMPMGDNPAAIVTAENGCGMTPEFLCRQLLRLVGNTKGSPGMGIGASRARAYLRQLYCDTGASPGVGDDDRFEIRMPAA